MLKNDVVGLSSQIGFAYGLYIMTSLPKSIYEDSIFRALINKKAQ